MIRVRRAGGDGGAREGAAAAARQGALPGRLPLRGALGPRRRLHVGRRPPRRHGDRPLARGGARSLMMRG
eukprot:5497932-Prymnesium_polylepis.1